jgi:hypothetical protein
MPASRTAGPRRRLAVLAVAGSLLAGLATVVAPAAAEASYPPNYCDNTPDLGDYHFVDQHEDLYIFHLRSAAQTFDVADSRSFNNTTENPESIQVNVTKTGTTTLTTGVDVTFAPISALDIENFLTVKVSQSITMTHTTAIGAQLTYQVPPLAQVIFDYGTVSYDVVYDVDKFELSQGHCWWLGSRYAVTAHAPTTNEQWRTVILPTISPRGVVYYADYRFDHIRAGEPVVIFGQGFVPTDTVLVDYANGYHASISAGTAWWFDQPGQINAALPAGVTGSASVRVRGANGYTSNPVYIVVN